MVNYINWWERVDFVRDTFFDTFFKKMCDDWSLNHNEITMFSVFGPAYNLVNNKNKCKIFFTGENTQKRFLEYSNEVLIANHVDIIAGFFTSTSKNVRLPLWAINWNFDTEGLFDINRNKIEKNSDKKVVLIARHDNGGVRNNIANQVQLKGLEVHTNCHQICNPTRRIHVEEGFTSKKKVLQNYIFTICPENTDTEGYVTEKLFEAFDGGCIPIYWPNRKVEENIINNNNILFISELSSIKEVDDDLINKKQKEEVWMPDALYWIYMMYLELWCRVWKCLKTTDSTLRIGCESVLYRVQNKNEIEEIVKTHYLQYKNFYTPRMRFCVTNSQKEDNCEFIELEEWGCEKFKLN
jgi:alpha(1,3/1,4) fucosyltransferase